MGSITSSEIPSGSLGNYSGISLHRRLGSKPRRTLRFRREPLRPRRRGPPRLSGSPAVETLPWPSAAASRQPPSGWETAGYNSFFEARRPRCFAEGRSALAAIATVSARMAREPSGRLATRRKSWAFAAGTIRPLCHHLSRPPDRRPHPLHHFPVVRVFESDLASFGHPPLIGL
jgi:hypothetical protein